MRAGRPSSRIAWSNEGYDPGDGFFYQSCYRCGINFEIPNSAESTFCRDCRFPDLIGVFRMLDYSYIFEGAA